uniref:Uncharacterized protein n=1 Tax=Panagrolaimus sp. ES5 TaxID=591445 RepID=A0AC34GUX7_9BILA
MDYTNYENSVNNSNNIINNNQTGYNRSFGYPSGSRTAESGPITRFRQTHGYENNSPTMSNEVNRNYQSQERAEMFLNNNYFPNYSSGGSRPESVMSNFSTLSVATNMSELSVITNASHFSTHMGGGSSASMYPNHNTYPPSSFPSYERQSQVSMSHPNDYLEKLTMAVEKGLDCNEELLEAKSRAKTQFFEYVGQEYLARFVRTLFCKLYASCSKKPEDFVIAGNVINVFHSLLHYNIQPPQRGRAKFEIIRFIRKQEKAISLFLSVLQTDLGFEFKKLLINNINTVIHEARKFSNIKVTIQEHPNIVSTYLSFLQCDNKIIYSISMDSLSRIISGSDKLKRQFMDQNGIELVLNIIANENQEKILYRAAELLSYAVSTDNDSIALRFINGHGIDICARLLDHGSSRLLYKLVECIQNVCDKLSSTNFDAAKSFKHLIMLIGTQDHCLESKVIGCLGNMISNNDRNKKMLCDLNVPTNLLRAIVCFTDPTTPIYGKIKTDLLDNILFVLQGLTGINVPADIKNSAIHQIINYEERIWEKWFMYFIANEQITIVNRALIIVFNILIQLQYGGFEPNENISAFKKDVENVFWRVYQAVKLLNPGDQQTLSHFWIKSALFEVSANLYPSAEEYEKQQKPIKLLLSRSLKLLRVLVNDNEAKHILARRMLKQQDFPLNFVLGFTANPEIIESMFFIAAALLQCKPELIQIWYNSELEAIIQNLLQFSQNNAELQKAISAFCNVLKPCYNLLQQQQYSIKNKFVKF